MAKTDQKTLFKFIGKRTETAQQKYDNLIEDTSYTYIKFKNCITDIAQDSLNINNTEQQQNKQKIETLRDRKQQLRRYKDQTIKKMDETAMILNRTYTKQTKNNHKTAKTIMKTLNKEETKIRDEYKTWNKIIYIITSPQPQQQQQQTQQPQTIHQNTTNNTTHTTQQQQETKQETTTKQQQTPTHQKQKYTANHTQTKQTHTQPLCTNCNSDRHSRHFKQHCKAIRCSNTWCGKFFHSATQFITIQLTPYNQQQQQTP